MHHRFADRIVMAVLRLLASPACAILLSFAADGRREWPHQGSHGDVAATFLRFGAGAFLL